MRFVVNIKQVGIMNNEKFHSMRVIEENVARFLRTAQRLRVETNTNSTRCFALPVSRSNLTVDP